MGIDVTRDVRESIELLAMALGLPVATPEWIFDRGRGRLSTYREFRWDCPVCRAGLNDPLGIYRPLMVDTEGRFGCSACLAPASWIVAEVERLLAERVGEVAGQVEADEVFAAWKRGDFGFAKAAA